MLNTIDLFVGCGGLLEGFEQSMKYHMLGAVEWDPSPVKELRNRVPANLQAKLEETNAAKKLVRRVPALKEVVKMVEQAKALDPVMTY